MSGLTTNLKAATPATTDSGKDVIVAGALEVLDQAITKTTTITITSGTRVLSDLEVQSAVLKVEGVLTANAVLEFTRPHLILVANDTTGAFTLTVRKGAAGGVTIAQTARKWVWVKPAANAIEAL